MSYTFRYAAGSIARPVLVCSVEYGTKSYTSFAVVDSGADDCIFPEEAAVRLGIDLARCPQVDIRGISGPGRMYQCDVRLRFDFGIFRARAGFTETLNRSPRGFLGQRGFFDQARVAFDHKAGLFTVDPYASVIGRRKADQD